ncbi:MAG TPA: cation-transporting P-type ATPase [Myxococcales bacterium]|jgi:calcium-translocating P-type ATPase
MQVQRLTVGEAWAALRSSPLGLSSDEAARRLREFGPNRIERPRKVALLQQLRRDFFHFFALLLWAAAGLAFFAGRAQPGSGMERLGLAILAVILVNGVFSFWQEHRAERAMEALERLLPKEITAVREGVPRRLPAEQAVPGDVLLLEEGEEVPADCRVIESWGATVNDSALTGESLPRPRSEQPAGEEELARAPNVVLAGSSLASGRLRAVVFATGMRTEFGQIARLTQASAEPLSPLQKEIARLSRVIALLSCALGALFFALGRMAGLPFWDCFLFAVGIIVANVPEGLLPTVTLSLALAAQRMSRRKALVRHLPSVEALGAATVICTDKTGTLTENRMSARRLFLSLEEVDRAQLDAERIARSRPLFEAALLCEGATVLESGAVGDPTELALIELARETVGAGPEPRRLGELPFDPLRRRRTTLHQGPDGPLQFTKGALEALLPLCGAALVGGQVRPLDAALREAFVAAEERFAGDGLRVLAFCFRQLPRGATEPEERDLVLTGLVGLEDPPRPEVPEAVRRCREAGIRVLILTGDHPRTALALARRIGLVQGEAPTLLTGEAVRRMSSTALQLALDAPEVLFARLAPDQKLRIVLALQQKREVVAVTGDGVNDAPALRAADVGVAMGRSGTDVARQVADLVLADDNFASIVDAVEEGRAVFANIRRFMTYILTSNVPEAVPYLAFSLFRVPLALTVLQILAVDLGTDLLPALGLGVERPTADVMRAPPRRRSERLVSGALLARAYLFLGLLEAAGSMAVFFYVLGRAGWRSGSAAAPALYAQATTACLATIVAMQVANVFLCRSDRESLGVSRAANPWIGAGVAVELALVAGIAYTGVGNAIYGTAPVSPEVWLLAAGCALAMVAAEELRKLAARALASRRERRAPVARRWARAAA